MCFYAMEEHIKKMEREEKEKKLIHQSAGDNVTMI